jgi:prepilin signal peptidase PulO-like enzyme (type II secretory pathway)
MFIELIPIYLIIFILGLCIGSFLNVLIDRLPVGESVLVGRSHCDYCKKTLRWYELVPLFSFLIQKFRCRSCHKKLSFQYPLMELITGIGFVIVYYFSKPSGEAELISLLVNLVIFSVMLVILMSDLKFQIIPDSMIVIGMIAALIRLMAMNFNFQFSIYNFQFIIPYLLSALCASAFFFLLWLFTKGRGIGFGDVKLELFLGLLNGFPGTIFALYVAFLTGAFIGVILILTGKKKWQSKIAFGPFLIAGAVIALIFNNVFLGFWKGVI